MTPLRLRLKSNEFHAVKTGKQNEVVKYASNKRIHHLCFSRMTKECDARQSECRECFENARDCDGYMCYPFEAAIIRKGQTDKYTTRRLTNIFFEERNGETVFVFRLEPLENATHDQV